MSDDQEITPENFVIKYGHFSVIEEDLDFPFDDLESRFDNVTSWLQQICDEGGPAHSIKKYRIGLIYSEFEYTLSFHGVNAYQQDRHTELIKIEFQPNELFFALPNDYFEGPSYDALKEKLMEELSKFANIDPFKKSFISQAQSVIFQPTGDVLWPEE